MPFMLPMKTGSIVPKIIFATSFVAKGKEGKLKEQKSQMRSILGKVRSTTLEGSFGNEMNHYQMNKIKAKTQRNEKT